MSYIQFQQRCLDCNRSWNAAFGIVGSMDYEDAKPAARANGQEEIRLFCVRFRTDGSAERMPSDSKRATALLVTINETAAFEAPPRTLLRCVVVEE